MSCWLPWRVKEGDTARFFLQNIRGTGAIYNAENMSRPTTSLERSINVAREMLAFGRKKRLLFSGRAASKCSKACLYKASRKYSKNWLRRISIKSKLAPEIEYTPKPSNYVDNPWPLHFTAQKSKCPRRFWEIGPEFLHVFNVSLASLLPLSFFFSLEIGDPSRPKYP